MLIWREKTYIIALNLRLVYNIKNKIIYWRQPDEYFGKTDRK